MKYIVYSIGTAQCMKPVLEGGNIYVGRELEEDMREAFKERMCRRDYEFNIHKEFRLFGFEIIVVDGSDIWLEGYIWGAPNSPMVLRKVREITDEEHEEKAARCRGVLGFINGCIEKHEETGQERFSGSDQPNFMDKFPGHNMPGIKL